MALTEKHKVKRQRLDKICEGKKRGFFLRFKSVFPIKTNKNARNPFPTLKNCKKKIINTNDIVEYKNILNENINKFYLLQLLYNGDKTSCKNSCYRVICGHLRGVALEVM